MQCILCIVFYVLLYIVFNTMHCILFMVLYAMYFCILCIVCHALYTVHCIICIVFYLLNSVHVHSDSSSKSIEKPLWCRYSIKSLLPVLIINDPIIMIFVFEIYPGAEVTNITILKVLGHVDISCLCLSF